MCGRLVGGDGSESLVQASAAVFASASESGRRGHDPVDDVTDHWALRPRNFGDHSPTHGIAVAVNLEDVDVATIHDNCFSLLGNLGSSAADRHHPTHSMWRLRSRRGSVYEWPLTA